jgi:hypothetical protein
MLMKNVLLATLSCAMAYVSFACNRTADVDLGGVDPGTTSPGTCDETPQGDCYPTDDIGTAPRQGNIPGQRIPNLQFFGFKNLDPSQRTDPSGELQRVTLAEFYDPTGSRLKLIHLIGASVWCHYCNVETEMLASGGAADLSSRGVVFLQALIDGPKLFVGATPDNLREWVRGPRRDEGGRVFETPLNFTVMLDPDHDSLGPFFQADSVPFSLNIDPRSMEILSAKQGFAASDYEAEFEEWLTWIDTHPPKGSE